MIRVGELAATHRLGKIHRLRMLHEQKAWKREAGFDYSDTAAEMDARRSRTNLVSEPFFYSKMFSPRCPNTHEEFTLQMRVDVEGLRMEIVLSQPEPPLQCDASPRRLLAVDTGSEEPETPRRLPAIGTGSDEPGVLQAQSTERNGNFSLQASVDEVDDNDEATTGTSQQAPAREELARPTKKRQQQRTTAWTTKQSKQFDPGGQQWNHYFSAEKNILSRILFASFSCVRLLSLVLIFVMSTIFRSRYERRWERLACARCVTCCTWTAACIVISICVNEGYSL